MEQPPGPSSTGTINGISHDMGTAVTVMPMVFGNLGPTSGSGVLFTRDPGHRREGKYTASSCPTHRARTWLPGCVLPKSFPASRQVTLPQVAPGAVGTWSRQLESHYRDVQDVEFTIENEPTYSYSRPATPSVPRIGGGENCGRHDQRGNDQP